MLEKRSPYLGVLDFEELKDQITEEVEELDGAFCHALALLLQKHTNFERTLELGIFFTRDLQVYLRNALPQSWKKVLKKEDFKIRISFRLNVDIESPD